MALWIGSSMAKGGIFGLSEAEEAFHPWWDVVQDYAAFSMILTGVIWQQPVVSESFIICLKPLDISCRSVCHSNSQQWAHLCSSLPKFNSSGKNIISLVHDLYKNNRRCLVFHCDQNFVNCQFKMLHCHWHRFGNLNQYACKSKFWVQCSYTLFKNHDFCCFFFF